MTVRYDIKAEPWPISIWTVWIQYTVHQTLGTILKYGNRLQPILNLECIKLLMLKYFFWRDP